MKIIAKDNLARETVADKLIIGGIPNTSENRIKAKEFCKWINTFSCDDHGGYYHDVVENDYVLSRGMEDLV